MVEPSGDSATAPMFFRSKMSPKVIGRLAVCAPAVDAANASRAEMEAVREKRRMNEVLEAVRSVGMIEKGSVVHGAVVEQGFNVGRPLWSDYLVGAPPTSPCPITRRPRRQAFPSRLSIARKTRTLTMR